MRQRVIIRLIIFLAPVIIILTCIEVMLSAYPNTCKIKKQLIEKNAGKIEVLVLGNSHEAGGVNPAYISANCFNLAIPSQTTYYDIELALKYADKLPKLKLVILPVDYFSLSAEMQYGPEGFRAFFYYRYWDIGYKGMDFWDIRKYLWLPVYSRDFAIKQLFKASFVDVFDENGFYGNGNNLKKNDNLQNLNDSLGEIRILSTNKMMHAEERSYITGKLENCIKQLKAKNIEVVIITSPVFHTYSDHADKNIIVANSHFMDMLCAKYNLKYLNYYTDPRFTAEDFKDCDHLNFFGAKKWSMMIDSEIVKPVMH